MNGEGIGKWQDVTFFIKDAVVGDEIEAAVTKMKKHYGYGRVVRIEKPSPFRVEPRCPVAKAAAVIRRCFCPPERVRVFQVGSSSICPQARRILSPISSRGTAKFSQPKATSSSTIC